MSILLCLAVIGLMIYTSMLLGAPSYIFGDLEQGYYLIYPSLVMFVLTFLQNEITMRRKCQKLRVEKRLSLDDVVSSGLAKSVHDSQA
jgi:hypothetical protein